MIRTTAIVACLLLTSALTLAAQDPSRVDIHGIVVDRSTGAPIRGAAVKIAGQKWPTVTDQNGSFRLRRVTPGTVTVEAEQLGYAEWSQAYEAAASAPLLRIELAPNPILLKAVQVTADRMRARRNSVPMSAWVYSADQLNRSTSFDAYEFLRARLSVRRCPENRMWWVSDCIFRRGNWIAPTVYVDEAHFIGGLDVLMGWPMSELYLIEVYGAGSQIRIYTRRFAELLATGRARLTPVIITY